MKHLLILFISFSFVFAYSQNPEINTYKKAYSLFENGQYDTALSVLDTATNLKDLNEEFAYLKAECYFEMKEYSKAIENFKQSYKLKNKQSLYRIAESYANLSNPLKATEYLKVYLDYKDKLLRSEIRSDPDFSSVSESKEWISLWKNDFYNSYEKDLDEARYNISKENYADAFYILDNLINKNKNRYRAFEMRGDLHMITENFKKAYKDFSNASEIRKKNITYQIKKADALLYMEKYSKSAEIYQNVYSETPWKIDYFVNKAKAEFYSGDYQKSKLTASEFVLYYPKDAQANYILAKSYEKENDLINALLCYNSCIESGEENRAYFVSRGDIYYQTKMYENAVKDYTMALDLNPRSGEIYYKRGISKLKTDPDSACKDFQKALDLSYYKAGDMLLKHCR
jgi:tetratricopeptide (TPR) repeat protein